MFKNKHVVAAFIIAPILSIGAYFATDFAVSERPHVAKEGASYPLVAQSRCRYESGICTLANGELKLDITISKQQDLISVHSNQDLSGIELMVSRAKQDIDQAQRMELTANQALPSQWQAKLPDARFNPIDDHLYLVAKTPSGVIFYGDSTLIFSAPKQSVLTR